MHSVTYPGLKYDHKYKWIDTQQMDYISFIAEKGFSNFQTTCNALTREEFGCLDATMSLDKKLSCITLKTEAKSVYTVWISGLFYKMLNLGVQEKTWVLL
jgi:hypothetical protein